MEELPECKEKHAFLLLIGYTGLNFLFNTLGLFLTKHGSAVLNGMSYSILLPLTTIAFSLPLLGPYQETLSPYTFGGLGLVLGGFLLYQHFSDRVQSGDNGRSRASSLANSLPQLCADSGDDEPSSGRAVGEEGSENTVQVQSKQSSFQ